MEGCKMHFLLKDMDKQLEEECLYNIKISSLYMLLVK